MQHKSATDSTALVFRRNSYVLNDAGWPPPFRQIVHNEKGIGCNNLVIEHSNKNSVVRIFRKYPEVFSSFVGSKWRSRFDSRHLIQFDDSRRIISDGFTDKELIHIERLSERFGDSDSISKPAILLWYAKIPSAQFGRNECNADHHLYSIVGEKPAEVV